MDEGYKIVTITHPHSIFALQTIADKLPNSFFIFVNRDKYDVGSELFKSNFTEGHEYSYDPEDILNFIDFYKTFCGLFKLKVPQKTMQLSFDRIINEPESVFTLVSEFSSISLQPRVSNLPAPRILSKSLFRDYFKNVIHN